uniref:Alpha-methylacyl-CoA racemase n=1 Tax=Acrobeloides nanus TaxID=290746 RepID=A0A914EAQ2_9BILA
MNKPFKSVKVTEIAGLAPVPYCGLILADFGADVTLVQKVGGGPDVEQRLSRGKNVVTVDYKNEKDMQKLKKICLESDVLLDPYRPGVLENIGLDPVNLLKENPKLIVARLTGYGQTGELAKEAGHDINYVAITGLMPTLAGHKRTPYWPPANLLADFAGGGLTAAFGIGAALFQRTQNGGKGCIIDCSMVEGLAYLGTFVSMYKDVDYMWNMDYAFFSGMSPIYRTYETKDGKFMAIGALEPKFHIELFKILNIENGMNKLFEEPANLVETMEKIFKTKTQAEWVEVFQGKDACVTPVLEIDQVGQLKHHRERDAFNYTDGKWVPKPAPRLYSPEEFNRLRQEDLNSKSKI